LTGGGSGSRARETALAGIFFLAYTVLATWPQGAHLGDAMADLWDAKLTAWILHWDYVQTLRDPLNLFQAPILHPAKYVLAFSENLYGAAVFGFPLFAGGASPVFVYNVLLLLGMCLSGWTAWALGRYVTGDPAASLVAGLVYGFLPYKLAQLAHFHMEWGPFLPLVFLYLLRYFDGGKRRDAVLLGAAFAANAITCIQYAFFTSFLVAVVLIHEYVQGPPERRRRLRGAILALGLGTLAFLPFAIPYKKASELYGMRRTVGEMTFFSARPGYFLSAGVRNRLWGPVTARWQGPEGDFFPGLIPAGLAGLAILKLRRRRKPASPAGELPPWRHRVARAFDVLVLLLAALWFVVRASPHLRVGPMSMGDAGRVQVFLTIAVVARLALAFPKRSRFLGLGDFLRRRRLDPRAQLLVLVAATGVLVALGGHTPYYRFLFQTFGVVFRAIRVAARGVVLFQVAIAVLAAWGLSLLTRNRSPAARRIGILGAIALITLEYRAFPVVMMAYDSSPVPVYEWLRTARMPGGVVEWPLGFPHDCEYTLRQAEHEKPLVNGHSSFAPRPYEELQAILRQRPIPDSAWDAMAGLDAALLIYHAHEGRGPQLAKYAHAIRRGLASGEVEIVGDFPHADGRDFAFRLTKGPRWDAPPAAGGEAQRLEDAIAWLEANVARLEPPVGTVHLPAENQKVAPGFWVHGWAVDDSGLAEIRVATELGPAGVAMLGSRWGGVEAMFPDYLGAATAGYGFPVPDLPPGPHTLRLTLVARDGGTTTLERRIVVAPPPPSPARPR
jgi:hypothetical protein